MKVKVVGTLTYLNVGDNKLFQPGSESLAQFLSAGGKSFSNRIQSNFFLGGALKTLILSNTSPDVEILVNAMKQGCPRLQTLDLSKNKFRINDSNALIEYLPTASHLTKLNLSCTKPELQSLKDLLTSVSKDTYLNINLR
jgi:Ran GTPase-activating protein (RanGAP) involved in mRNA processing and transport